ncbi:MAG: hypothetical protein AAFR96_10495 [Planctomycetota bacterium]
MTEETNYKGGTPDLPNQARLPLRARFALSARCVERVMPLMRDTWPEIDEKYERAVLERLRLVQQFASGNGDLTGDYLRNIEEQSRGSLRELAQHDQAVAFNVAEASRLALVGAAPEIATAGAALYSLQRRGREMHEAYERAIEHDFRVLMHAAAMEQWSDDSPVSPRFLGPLWPEGEPEGWPEDTSVEPDPFEFVLDPGDANQDEIREVLTALSDFHAAHTGYVLRYDVQGSRVMAFAEVES